MKQISDNEIYLLIKYIKSVLWRVAKCLSYIEDARCLRVKHAQNFIVFTGDPTHLKDQSSVVTVSVAISLTEKFSARFRPSNVDV